MKITKSKNLDIELMRMIACFFVIFNHTAERGFFYLQIMNLAVHNSGYI